jgi:CubicO group peptidase (beta-lactamase class C family)
LDKLYAEAAELETLYGLLVIVNGHLIAEGYFNEGSIDQVSGRQSSTKSFTSALVGIALDRGCLQSVDQKMIDFFPEFADEIIDPRKEQITIEHLLQMRGGYPDEEMTSNYFEIMFFHDNWDFVPHLVDFPLSSDPGTEFHYSNLTSHLLGVIVTRACGQDLESYARQHLFLPMNADLYGWQVDDGGNTTGAMDALERALALAEPGGFIRIFVDEGPPMAHLLHEAAARGIAPEYTRRLLAAFPVTTTEVPEPANPQLAESDLIEPLSERELEVLALLAEGLTNREIASRLFLALNTVKAHTGNIYGKLNVHSRTQAIARAQALGLLPPK